jgi:hypothetical protein
MTCYSASWSFEIGMGVEVSRRAMCNRLFALRFIRVGFGIGNQPQSRCIVNPNANAQPTSKPTRNHPGANAQSAFLKNDVHQPQRQSIVNPNANTQSTRKPTRNQHQSQHTINLVPMHSQPFLRDNAHQPQKQCIVNPDANTQSTRKPTRNQHQSQHTTNLVPMHSQPF